MKQLKISSRAKRMGRFQQRRKQSSLNLVSLMDIFTILVFFLLVSSSNVQQIPGKKDVKLPTSVAQKAPKETIILAVTKDSILVQGRKVVDIQNVMADNNTIIPELKKELLFQSSKTILSAEQKSQGRSVTIFGDENIQYELLRKILATSREANYLNIAFAAIQKSKGKT